MSKYDLVIYGASGFTGQFVIEYVERAAQQHQVSWAVAGRSEGRLRAALARAGAVLGTDLSRVPTIECDSNDSSSLLTMARQARLVLNCVGPYRFYGESVVEACVEAGAHHLDISGEPQYLEKMQLKYHQKAVENGVYVVGACGFDSIPADLGQICVRREMEGDVNSVETYLEVQVPDLPGAAINFATFQSAIHGFANAKELKGLRRQIYPERMPTTKPKLQFRGNLHHSELVDSWCLPFMGSDKSVMTRTVRSLYHDKGHRPTQINCYVQFQSIFKCLMLMLVGMVFGLLASFSWGRKLLENYPGLFTFGKVSKDGVPREKAENTNFIMTVVGEGWSKKVGLEETSEPTRRVITTVSGKNIGYGSTCECLVQAGLVILQEEDKLPNAGGVYSPGYAFAETSLTDRLTEKNVTFRTVVQEI